MTVALRKNRCDKNRRQSDRDPLQEAAITLDRCFQNYSRERIISGMADRNGWISIDGLSKLHRFEIIFGGHFPNELKLCLKKYIFRHVEINSIDTAVRKKPTVRIIREIIESWFDPEYWSQSLLLQTIAEEYGAPDTVPLSALVPIAPIPDYLAESPDLSPLQLLATSLRDSDILEVVDGGTAARRRTLKERVRKQIEYYFSDDNYSSDTYLQSLVALDPQSFVRLEVILTWPRLTKILLPSTPIDCVAIVLSESSVVEVSADGLCIRKRPSDAKEEEVVYFEDDDMIIRAPCDAMAKYAPSKPYAEVGFMPPFPALSPTQFTAVQFNMLAQFLSRAESHLYADPRVLRWDYRSQLFEEGLARLDADIVTLQELQGMTNRKDRDNHAGFVRDVGARLGYGFLYCRKTDRFGQQKSRSMGDAILYRKSTFTLVEYKYLSYAKGLEVLCTDENQRQRYLAPKVAILCKLVHNATGNPVVVASTHISCSYDDPDIQIAQVGLLMVHLQEYARLPHSNKLCPVILCGDFNTLPNSTCYRLLSEGSVSEDDPDTLPRDPSVKPLIRELCNPCRDLKLRSAYKSVTGAEPTTTNLKGPPVGFTGCLDYIWHHGIDAVSVLPIGSVAELSAEGGGVPNSKYPSDHVPIGARFQF